MVLMESDAHADGAAFPRGALDGDQQQIDLRQTNSWVMPLSEVYYNTFT